MICPYCRNQVPDGLQNCPHCGSPLKITTTQPQEQNINQQQSQQIQSDQVNSNLMQNTNQQPEPTGNVENNLQQPKENIQQNTNKQITNNDVKKNNNFMPIIFLIVIIIGVVIFLNIRKNNETESNNEPTNQIENNEPNINNDNNNNNNNNAETQSGSEKNSQKFEVKFHVLSKEEGGRHTPFFSNYEPDFIISGNKFDGSITLPTGVEMVNPGDDITITVNLKTPTEINIGTEVQMQEGQRIVATGTVTKVY